MSLFVAVLVSLIGMALITYGRKSGRGPHMVVGLILVIYPYFLGNVYAQVAVAVALLAGLALVSRLGY